MDLFTLVKSLKQRRRKVLVHYCNWNSKYDEWIEMDGGRIRESPSEFNFPERQDEKGAKRD